MRKFHTKLFFAVFIIITFFITNNAYAVGIELQESYKSTVKMINKGHGVEDEDEYNSARSQGVGLNTTVSNLLLLMAPEVTSGYAEILESDDITPDMKRGVFGMAKDSVVSMYNSQPYVNVYAHLKNEWTPGENIEGSTTLYAASPDSGYQELLDTGVNSVWKFVLNATYVIFILIMIVVGFMIMFRSKIGGQTLVTLGNSLPNVVLALIGATFSFAIAGLIIDIGGIIMGLIIEVFESVGGYSPNIRIDTLANIARSLFPTALLKEIIDTTLHNYNPSNWGSMLGSLKIGDVFSAFSMIKNFQTMGLISIILILAAITVGTVGVFKVFLTLVKAYFTILLNVIIGPLKIAVSAIPGKGVAFINWMKDIFRAVLIYPVTFAILNLPNLLYQLSGGEFKFPGPDKLTNSNGGATIVESLDNLSGMDDILNYDGMYNALMIFAIQIFVLFIASKADKYVLAIIPPTTSREGSAAAEEMKRSLSGIPFIGKLLSK